MSAGHPVIAAANPLRGLAADAAAVSDLVRTIDGPVVLVAHSYGGAVISNVAADAGEIIGLVYVTASHPIPARPASRWQRASPAARSARRVRPVPRSDGTTDLYIVRDRFHDQFCADVPAPQAARMAATQRPATQEALDRAVGRAAAVARAAVVVPDRRGGPQHPRRAPALHGRARRRAAATIEIPGASHAVAVSQPRGDGST